MNKYQHGRHLLNTSTTFTRHQKSTHRSLNLNSAMHPGAKFVFFVFMLSCFATVLSTKYTVYIMTGWQGTSSRVQLRLVGSNGRTSSHVLNPNGKQFIPNRKTVFTIDDKKDVGQVTSVDVYLDTGTWFIRKILVTAGGAYIFNFNKKVSPGQWTGIGVKCTKGFRMGPNGQCLDIDECKASPCKSSEATCHNTYGSYQCACPNGYNAYYDRCIDIDECSFDNTCKYKWQCVNTPGSYRCDCKTGYRLEEGSCVDIDECKEGTDSCDHVSTYCTNSIGGFNCKCKQGFKWTNSSRTRCDVNFCSPQKPDNLTSFSPARCLKENANRHGDTCTRKCAYGYELLDQVGYKTIRCQDGHWRGIFTNTYCAGRKCPALPTFNNSFYLPIDCCYNGGRYKGKPCEQYCNSGYQKINGDPRVCQKDGTWTGSPIVCKKLWPDPWITCPPRINKNLQPGKNTSSVGSKWRFPQSNYKFYTVSPAGVNSLYQFPAGYTKVQWSVTNPDGKTAKCVRYVLIHDRELPKIVYCPAHTIFYPAYTKGPYHVNYKEPEFSDNVGIDRISKTFVTRKFKSKGIWNQEFTAYDKAGNSVSCRFTVAIGGTKCTLWPDDRSQPGSWVLQASSPGQRSVLRTCPNGLITTDVKTLGLYNCNKTTGKWHPDRVRDCVDFKIVNKTQQCGPGYAKKFAFGKYYCVQCGLGTYLKDVTCTMCPVGQYLDKRGQSACNKCPSGTSSMAGDFKCRELCPPGTFSKDGMKPFCTLCPEGQHQDKHGHTSCTACPKNKFTNTKLGATTCQDAEPSGQHQKSLLGINSVIKPKEWDIKFDNASLECYIKDNNYNLVSVQWKIINNHNIPEDFLGKPKFKEIRNHAGKIVGSRLVLTQTTMHNARLDYVCVAANVNGETRTTVNIPWPSF